MRLRRTQPSGPGFLTKALLWTLLLFPFVSEGAITNKFRLTTPPFFHRLWQYEDGLPNPSVRAITQNREGYLLLATDEGLHLFDGIGFREIERKKTPGKAQRWMTGLLQSRDGSIWASAVDGGLMRSAGGKITRYQTNNSPLPNDYVLSLHEDSKTNLWIGTASGLSRINNGMIVNYTNTEGLTVEATRSIVETQDGMLWIATANGLSRFDGQKFSSFYTNGFLLNNAVYCLHEDRQGGLWIGTAGGLTYLRDGKPRHFTEKDGLAHNNVRVILEDSQKRLWIGSLGGLQLLKDGQFETVKLQSVTEQDYRINSVVYSIFEDREGTIWVGTHLGLNQIRNQPVTVYSREEGLPAEVITSICQADNGVVWIGTYGGGLCRFGDGELVTYNMNDGLPSNHVLSLCIDSRGTVWIGSDGGGLARFANGKFTHYFSEEDPKANVIRAITRDHRGVLFLGSNAGVHRLEKGKMVPASHLPGSTVKAIVEDRARNLWFAGDDSLVKVKTPAITKLRDQLGFTSHTANTIYPGKDDDYYIGTDNGLFCFWQGRFHHITSHPELQYRRIFGIVEGDGGLEDEGENLWLSTQTGILAIPKRELLAHISNPALTLSVSSFGKQEGMRRSQCNGVGNPTLWKMRDGRIWFATMNGVAVIEASTFRHNLWPPPLEIERLTVDGSPVPLAPSIELPPGKGNLEFAYAGLSLRAPEKVRFMYQLEGIDADWVDAGSRRVARYANVAPGTYRFKVKGANNDGVWNEIGASLDVRLLKPFHETTWFRSVCIGGFLAISGLAVFARMRAGRERESQLQTEVARHTEKLRKSLKTMESFNYSIAHDLRAPLRAIKGLTMALQEDYSSAYDSTGQDYSRRITEAVDRMDSLIGDLLAFGSISHKDVVFANVDLDTLVPKVIENFNSEITEKKAIVRVDHPLGVVLANETLLQQILTNLISNALKFMPFGVQPQLKLWTEKAGARIRINVEDNGIGIAKEHHERIFGVFERLHGQGSYPGTGIGLAIVIKAAERMEGSIGLRSEPGKGSCFWIELPPGKTESSAR